MPASALPNAGSPRMFRAPFSRFFLARRREAVHPCEPPASDCRTAVALPINSLQSRTIEIVITTSKLAGKLVAAASSPKCQVCGRFIKLITPPPLPKNTAFTLPPRLDTHATKQVSKMAYVSISKLIPPKRPVFCSKTAQNRQFNAISEGFWFRSRCTSERSKVP